MIDHALIARDAINSLDSMSVSSGKPVLLVGDDADRRSVMDAIRDASGATPINLNIELSQALVNSTATVVDIAAVIWALVPSSRILLLDRIQLLMLPQLRINALDVLCRVARRRVLCASWPGRLDQSRLRYADPDHPECIDEDASRALVLDMSVNESIHR